MHVVSIGYYLKNIYVLIDFSLTDKTICRKGRIQISYNAEHTRNYRLIYTDTMKKL